MLVEKLTEIITGDTGVYIVIYGNSNTYTVANAHAKTAGECYLIGNFVLFDGSLQQLYNRSRSLQMTGAADADLYYHAITPLPVRSR